jgi:hypothetical protein
VRASPIPWGWAVINYDRDPIVSALVDLAEALTETADEELDALIVTVDGCPQFALLRHQIGVLPIGDRFHGTLHPSLSLSPHLVFRGVSLRLGVGDGPVNPRVRLATKTRHAGGFSVGAAS